MNAASRQPTCWPTLIGTITTQFAFGPVYTWGLSNSSLSGKPGESVSQVAFSLGLPSLGLTLSSSVAGELQERFGVKHVTMASGVLLGLGFFLTTHSSSLTMLWLSAGVLVGLVDGADCLLTLSNYVKWFPKHKGLISTLSISSYGLGSLGLKFIDSHLLATVGLEKTFIIWSAIVLMMIVFGTTLMKNVPNHTATTAANGVVENDFTFTGSVREPQYRILAVMLLTAYMSGLYATGMMKDIARGMVHLDVATAANAVTVISIANLSGRLVLDILPDKTSCIHAITPDQIASLVGMAAPLFVPLNVMIFFTVIARIASNFGGTITVLPPLVNKFFDPNNLAKNYNVVYLGFDIGSICGFLTASLFGGFYATFYMIFALLILSLALSATTCQPRGNVYNEAYVRNLQRKTCPWLIS